MKDDVKHLTELIRKVNDLVNPEDSTDYLYKKDLHSSIKELGLKPFLLSPQE